MRAMLNAVGVSLWGAIAITLAAAVAVLGYRATTLPSYRSEYPAERVSPTSTHVKPTGPDTWMISRAIAKDMGAAQKAIQAQQWDEVTKNVSAAEQKPGLTPFDKKTIDAYRAISEVRLNRLKDAQADFEKALATGDATPDETSQWTKTLFIIAASTQQYQKAIDYGKTLVDNGTASNDNLVIIAQSYYLLKDCKNSGVWADKAIAAARRAGETPKETPFLFKLQCASDAGDTPAMNAVLVDLIKLNNKTSYWNTLLRIERQDEREDHNTLMIYRVMNATNSWNADTDYIEMAQLLGDASLPGEAAGLLDKAMSSGAIKDEHKERTTRLLTMLQTRADADRRNLPQEEAEASQSPGGELSVELGEVYYGFGEYQKAVDAITQGLQKGSVTQMGEALVYLGLAQVRLGRYAEAKETLSIIPAPSNPSHRQARLWRLYAATLSPYNSPSL